MLVGLFGGPLCHKGQADFTLWLWTTACSPVLRSLCIALSTQDCQDLALVDLFYYLKNVKKHEPDSGGAQL